MTVLRCLLATPGASLTSMSHPPGPDAGVAAELLQIGEVADRVGLSLRTIRYYEEMGLVEPETRTDGGFRLYTSVHVERLQVIRRMKPLGFSVQEIRDILDARSALADDAGNLEARERLEAYAVAIEQRCDDLHAKVARGRELAATLRAGVGP